MRGTVLNVAEFSTDGHSQASCHSPEGRTYHVNRGDVTPGLSAVKERCENSQ